MPVQWCLLGRTKHASLSVLGPFLEDLERVARRTEPAVLVVREDHPLADQDALNLADLSGLPFVVTDGARDSGASSITSSSVPNVGRASTVHRLTRAQARRMAVRAQVLDAARPAGLGPLMDRLTMLQLDPTAIAPCADLVAWTRVGSS
jgi:LysR substrate binding domain